ncbi:MAG TPA: hypothetical protein VF337_12440 [Candidatus Limnocylindrales bacterium]
MVRVIVRRGRADWPILFAAWLLLACSTSLVTAAATYSESVALGGFRSMIRASAPAKTAIRVYAVVPGPSMAAAEKAVAPLLDDSFGPAGTTSRIATSDSLSLAGADASDITHQIIVGSYDAIEAHAGLTAGRWAKPGAATTEATLSTSAAAALGLSVGDRVGLSSKLEPSRRMEIVIVGLWEPSREDRYWLGSGLELTGVASAGTSITRGPFVVAAADLPTLAGKASLNVEWRWLPDIESIQPRKPTGSAPHSPRCATESWQPIRTHPFRRVFRTY